MLQIARGFQLTKQRSPERFAAMNKSFQAAQNSGRIIKARPKPMLRCTAKK
jgi:hypothetical protein